VEGKTINFVRSEDNTMKAIVFDGAETMEVESGGGRWRGPF
jgi:hypothetical protein